MSDKLFDTYARLPVTFVRGEGPWLWDSTGKRYLDALSGIGVCALGHANPEIAETICRQSKSLIHSANVAHIEQQAQLAQLLCEVSGLDRAFFANSGAEANECAIKLARLHGHKRGIDNPAILVFSRSFHGRTLACLSASDSRKVQAGFEPLVAGFLRAPFNDIAAIEEIGHHNSNVSAILVEPIQGEGGVQVPDAGYLQAIRRLCDEHDWLMMVDEIQTGLCRTGDWYAYQHDTVRPDVITTAKALGNGVPVGACIADDKVAAMMTPGSHGSTFGGNQLACAAGVTTLKIMQRERLWERAAAVGERLSDRLWRGLKENDQVTEIRGRGLMIGIEFRESAMAIKQRALERGLLVNVTRDRVLRLLPPLIIDDQAADQIADVLLECV